MVCFLKIEDSKERKNGTSKICFDLFISSIVIPVRLWKRPAVYSTWKLSIDRGHLSIKKASFSIVDLQKNKVISSVDLKHPLTDLIQINKDVIIATSKEGESLIEINLKKVQQQIIWM